MNDEPWQRGGSSNIATIASRGSCRTSDGGFWNMVSDVPDRAHNKPLERPGMNALRRGDRVSAGRSAPIR